jgi:hypothetical protein
MNRIAILAFGLFICLGLISNMFAAQRMVVCEEWYQES